MSLHYILDGYNILQQIPKLALRRLEDGREGLISLIENTRPQGNRNNPVTVVFDGKPGLFHVPKSSTVKIVFSEGESADDRIRQMVSAAAKKRQMVVVTDDRELQASVKILGGQILAVKGFLQKTRREEFLPASQVRAKNKTEDGKNISKTLEYKINDEFSKIWLKGKKT